jgi:hypothetical protein
MIKSEINAARLDAQVYDCVVKLQRGGGDSPLTPNL